MIAIRTLPYVVCALVALGCNRNEATHAPPAPTPPPAMPTPTPTPAPTPAPAPTPSAPQPRVELTAPEYNLAVQIAAGTPPTFKLELRGAGEYHVNEQYPIAVEIANVDNGSMEKRSLRRADAAEFSQSLARFEQPVQSTGAGTTVRGTVRFGVCRAEQCGFFNREFAVVAP